MTTQRIDLIHWAPDPEEHVAACGETVQVSYIDGKNKYYRHIYVTLSTNLVTCTGCSVSLGMYLLAGVNT